MCKAAKAAYAALMSRIHVTGLAISDLLDRDYLWNKACMRD